MTDELVEWELQLLREVAGVLPRSPWGAAVGMGLEHLTESGYLLAGGRLTEKGKKYLEDNPILGATTPPARSTTFDLLLAASSRYCVRPWGSVGTHAVFDSRRDWNAPPSYGPYSLCAEAEESCRALNLEEVLRVVSTTSPERDATLRAHQDRALIEDALKKFVDALVYESFSALRRRPPQP